MSLKFILTSVLMAGMCLWAEGAVVRTWAAADRDIRPVPKQKTSPLPATAELLTRTAWRLVELQSMDDATGSIRPADATQFTMRLHSDGTVAMQLGCNRATGSWEARPAADGNSGSFAFGRLASTRALCPPPHIDEKITAQAEHVRSFLIRDGRLHLSLMADGGIFVWEPDTGVAPAATVPASPEQGGPRNWQVTGVSQKLNLRENPSTRAKIVAGYPSGTILDNLGCRSQNGEIWCDVQKLGGGPRGFVLARYLKGAVSPGGSVAIGPDDSALRAGQGVFDATGNIPCAQSAGKPMEQCGFGVARAGGGYATVVVKKPDGRQRAIFFRMGRAIGADTSQADGNPPFRASRKSDLNLIRIGNERYEIPDAVILGG